MNVKLSELKDIPFENEIKGIGASGIKYDGDNDDFEGYIYASKGYGNMESYISIQDALDVYNIGDWEVTVEFDVDGKICYLHS